MLQVYNYSLTGNLGFERETMFNSKKIQVLILAIISLLIFGCGSDDGGGGGGVNAIPAVTVTTPAVTGSDDILISYTLSDSDADLCGVSVEFSEDGGASYASAAEGAGGDGITSLTSDETGIVHTFSWDSLSDIGTTVQADIRIRILANDGTDDSTYSETADFTVDNNADPVISVTTPTGTNKGDFIIHYTLADADADTCSITVEFSEDGGAGYSSATPGSGGDGTIGLVSSAGGEIYEYVWDSFSDIGVSNQSDIRIQIRADDSKETGVFSASSDFNVDNTGNIPPSVDVATPTGIKKGNVVISYVLTDPDGQLCSITPYFSEDGGSTQTVATEGLGGDGTAGLSSSVSGVPHTFVWDSLADISTSSQGDIRFKLVPSDGIDTGLEVETADFTVDDTSNIPPSVGISDIAGAVDGDVQLTYDLIDSDGDTCTIEAEYKGGLVTTWTSATLTGTTTGITTGAALNVTWDSITDQLDTGGSDYQIRLRANDGTEDGDWDYTDFFSLSNILVAQNQTTGFDYSGSSSTDITLTCNKNGATWTFSGDPVHGTLTHIDGTTIAAHGGYPVSVVPAGSSVVVTYDRGAFYSSDPANLDTFSAQVEWNTLTDQADVSVDVNIPPAWGVIPTFPNLEGSAYADSIAGVATDADSNGPGTGGIPEYFFLPASAGTLGNVSLTSETDFLLTFSGTDGTGYAELYADDGHINGRVGPVKIYMGVNNTAPDAVAGLEYFGYDRTAGSNYLVKLKLTGSDPDGYVSLICDASVSSGDGVLNSIDPDTGEIEVEVTGPTDIVLSYTVSDGCAVSTAQNINITVVDETNFTSLLGGGPGTNGTGTSWSAMIGYSAYDATPSPGYATYKGIVKRSDSVSAWNATSGEQRFPSESATSVQQPPWDPVNVPYKCGTADASRVVDIDDDEGPCHSVFITNFFIQKTEVTNVEFVEFLNYMNDQGYLNADKVSVNNTAVGTWCDFTGTGSPLYGTAETDDRQTGRKIQYDATRDYFYIAGDNQEYWLHPVTHITWFGAMVFCQWMTYMDFDGSGFVYKLPTESEWEFAANGGPATTDPPAMPNPNSIGQKRFVPWYNTDAANGAEYWGEYRYGRWASSGIGTGVDDGVGADDYVHCTATLGAGIDPGSVYVYDSNMDEIKATAGSADLITGIGTIYDEVTSSQIGTIDYATGYIDINVVAASGETITVKYFMYESGYYDPIWMVGGGQSAVPCYTKYVCNFANIVKGGEHSEWAWVIMDPNEGDIADDPSNAGTLPVASFPAWPSSSWEMPEYMMGYLLGSQYDSIGNVWEFCYEEYTPDYYQNCVDAGGALSEFPDTPNPNDPSAIADNRLWPDPTESTVWGKIAPDKPEDIVLIKGGGWAGALYDGYSYEFGHGGLDTDIFPNTNYFDEDFRGRTEMWRITDRGGDIQMSNTDYYNNVGFRIIKRRGTEEVRPGLRDNPALWD